MHFENSNSLMLTWLHESHVQYLVHLGENTMRKIRIKQYLRLNKMTDE